MTIPGNSPTVPIDVCLPGEVWRPVHDYEGYYSISTLGRVYSHPRTVRCKRGTAERSGCVLRPVEDGRTGYVKVRLSKLNAQKTFAIHALVARAFIGPCPSGMQVAHKDGCRSNAQASNLRYDTQTGNERDKVLHGTKLVGSRVGNSKLTSTEVAEIRRSTRTQKDLAAMYGISQSHVSDLKNGKKWRHLGGFDGSA